MNTVGLSSSNSGTFVRFYYKCVMAFWGVIKRWSGLICWVSTVGWFFFFFHVLVLGEALKPLLWASTFLYFPFFFFWLRLF